MKCNSCGKRVKKNELVCSQCGKALAPEAMNTQELIDVMGELHSELDRIGEMRERSAGRKKRILIAMFVVVACLASSFFAMLYFRGAPDDATQTALEEGITESSGVPGEVVKKIMGAHFVNVSITDENAAQTAIEAVKSQFGIMGNMEFQLEHKHKIGNDTYYRFAQTCNGLDVFGGEAIVIASDDGTPLALHANFIETYGLDSSASLEKGSAANAINEYVNKMVPEYRVNEGVEISDVTKTVCNFEGKTYLAYTANVSGYNEKGAYVGFDVFVDADSGSGIYVSDTASYEKENIVDDVADAAFSSSLTDENATLKQPQTKAPVSAKGANYGIYTVNDKFNWNVSAKTASLEEMTTLDLESGNVTKFVADTKYAVDSAYSYFTAEHGWFGLDGKNSKFKVLLNANEYAKDNLPPEKALYSNNVLMFIETDIATTSIDKNVVAHEYAHGVMAHIAGLSGTNAKKENAVIAESMADIFAEFAEGTSPDWKHGDRNFTQVQAGYYYEVGDNVKILDIRDCYRYSTIISRSAYRMYADGIGTKKLGELFFRSLLTMTRYDNFEDFGTILELNAKIMNNNGTLSDVQFGIVTTALDNTSMRGEKLYVTPVDELGDSKMLQENEINPNEKIIE